MVQRQKPPNCPSKSLHAKIEVESILRHRKRTNGEGFGFIVLDFQDTQRQNERKKNTKIFLSSLKLVSNSPILKLIFFFFSQLYFSLFIPFLYFRKRCALFSS